MERGGRNMIHSTRRAGAEKTVQAGQRHEASTCRGHTELLLDVLSADRAVAPTPLVGSSPCLL